MSTSHVNPVQTLFDARKISAKWTDHLKDPSYIVYFGAASVHLLPTDAGALVAKLTTAMAAQGHAVDYPAALADAIRDLSELAKDLEFVHSEFAPRAYDILGQFGHASQGADEQRAAGAQQWAVVDPETGVRQLAEISPNPDGGE